MRLEYKQGTSAKFWEPSLAGSTITVRFGRIGTAGQTRATKLASPAAAKAALAKLVAEKRGKGYAPAKATRATPAKPKAAKPRKGRTELLAIATELGGAGVAKEVALAADDPERFVATTKHELFEDFDDDDIDDDLPWLALIEALDAKGRLEEVDWKECGTEILAGLERIGGAAAKRALAAAHEPTLDDRYTYEALQLFGKLLGAAGLALIALDKNSDSYALMVVAAKDVARLARVAQKAGGEIAHHTGKELAAEEQKRFKKDKTRQTTHPWQQLVVRYEYMQGTNSAVDSLLYHLRHDFKGEHMAAIRAAMPSAPKRDQPIIAMTLALYDGSPSRIAKTTKDPALCLRALNNLREEYAPFERLAAAAILADRLRVTPGPGKLADAVCEACNLWAKPKLVTAALGKLPKGARARLARIVEATLTPQSDADSIGYLAIVNVGDAASLPVLAAVGEKATAYLAKHGLDHGDHDRPWTIAAKQIAART